MTGLQKGKAAAAAFAKLIASTNGRQILGNLGYSPEHKIVLVDEDDLVFDVTSRVQHHKPPVFIAVYSKAKHAVAVLRIAPASPEAGAVEVDDRNCTIGILVDTLTAKVNLTLGNDWWKYLATMENPPVKVPEFA